MEQLFKIIAYILAFYLSFYSLYWLITTLLGIAYRPQKHHLSPPSKGSQGSEEKELASPPSDPNILLILPAYKPGKIFLKVADSIQTAIKGKNIKVYILLQEAEAHFSKQLAPYGFFAEEAKFSNLDGNSYHHALRHVVKKIDTFKAEKNWTPDFIMLIDKDNLLAPDFFENISSHEYENYDVIQARRCSINAHGNISFFDTVSEGLNDTMFRAAKSLVKGMIEISGSGALIRTQIFQNAINGLDQNAPGYDKNFMVQLLSGPQGLRTIYLPYLQLFEEKTSELENYNPQRVRWFGEQYYNAIYSAGKLLRSFVKYGRFAALEYLIALWRPPRSIQLLLLPMLAAIEISAYVWMGYWWLGFPFFLFSTIALGIAALSFLSKEKLLRSSFRHIFSLPKLAFSNIRNASESIKKENHAKFIHTEHKM